MVRKSVVVGLVCLLCACGGGGGGGPFVADGDTAAPSVNPSVLDIVLTTDASIIIPGVSSDDSDISYVRVNGIDVQSDDGFATWIVTLPTPNPVNEFIFSAEDAAGNVDAAAASVIVKRTDLVPQATLTNVTNGTTYPEATVSITVEGTASPSGSNADIVSVVVNGVNAASTDNFATWSVDIPLVLGSNTITVSVTDANSVNDPAAAVVSVVRLDETLPTVAISTPTNNEVFSILSSAMVVGSASDNDRIDRIEVNDIDATTTDNFSTWQAILPPPVGPRNVIVRARAYDPRGNSEQANVSIQFIDDVAPTGAITTPVDGSTTESQVLTVQGTASDEHSA
ncbi:MAG: hypothetical protein HKM24_07650, partial [Gammaproteobacteria bacterium]|nr:hypothetical protein [Gammaproteobacteria bacterium]